VRLVARILLALGCIAIAAALVASSGCSVSATKDVSLVGGGGQSFVPGDGGGVQGYIYVPPTGAASTRQALGVNQVLFPTQAAALAAHPDWVPALGVGVTVSGAGTDGASSRAAITTVLTGTGGVWDLFVSAESTGIVLDFSSATSPAYCASWGTVAGVVNPDDYIRWQPGLLKKTKDLTTVDGREKISGINSFSGTCQFTNQSAAASTIGLWVSGASDLGVVDLFDYSDPAHPTMIGPSGAPAFFFLCQLDIPASVGPHTIGFTWSDITSNYSDANLTALKTLVNPNKSDSITAYMAAQPMSTQVNLDSFVLRVSLTGNLLASAGGTKEDSTLELPFF
jgi:hypothetical protein